MSYYQYHVFFCINNREDGRQACAQFGAQDARNYVKNRCKELGIHGAGKVRINNSGCLDRCELGPVIVIYPEQTWYTYVDKEDLEEIIVEHLQHGRQVDRLRLPQPEFAT